MTEHSAAPNSQEDQAKPTTIGELFSRLSDQIRYLVKGEIDLAKAKAATMVKKMGTGIALLAVAGVLALYLLGVLLHAAILGFSLIMPAWGAALVVAGILLLIIIILALIGLNQLKKSKEDKPDPQTGLKKSAEAAKEGFKK